MTTQDKIDACLEHPDRLGEEAVEAFERMKQRLLNNKTVTDKQQKWVEETFTRLGLSEEAVNLYSEGKVKRGNPTPEIDHWMKTDKPLKPPGRRG